MNPVVSSVNEWSESIGWSSDGESNMRETRETMRKDLKYDENDRDDREELAKSSYFDCNIQGLCRVKVGKIQNNNQQNQVGMKGISTQDDSEQ